VHADPHSPATLLYKKNDQLELNKIFFGCGLKSFQEEISTKDIFGFDKQDLNWWMEEEPKSDFLWN